MVFSDTDRMMDNVQEHNICTNVPLSQTFRSSLKLVFTQKHLTNFCLHIQTECPELFSKAMKYLILSSRNTWYDSESETEVPKRSWMCNQI
jgi:hypothetical protein